MSATSGNDGSSPPDRDPDDRPDRAAFDEALETRASRRRVLQGIGAAGTAAVIGTTASTGTAEAAGLVDGVVSSIPGSTAAEKVAYTSATAGFGPAGFVGVAAIDKLDDALETNPTADQTILHNLCTTEFESLTAHEVQLSNRLKDAESIASLEARHGIATVWEDGGSATTAYDRAMQRIRQYYELPEFNHYHITNKSLIQLSHAAGSAVDTGNSQWVTNIGTDGSGTNIQVRMIEDRQEVDITLHDGTAISNVNPQGDAEKTNVGDSAPLTVPMVELRDTSASDINSDSALIDTVPMIDQSVVDSWDSSNEEVTLTASDGTTVTTDLRFVIPSVGDTSESGLYSSRVFDGVEFFKLLYRIKDQSDTVTANYSQSFVEDLFAELDAGNITPKQVRSPEGVARFLSGTDDVTDRQFRLSMMQQFDMAQPDFSRVSSMSVNWTGYTSEWVDPDPSVNERRTFPDEFVDGKSYNGVLFGDSKPDGGFQSGERYLVGPVMYRVGSSGTEAIDYESEDVLWSSSVSGRGADVNEKHDLLIVGDGNNMYGVDIETGEQLWSNSVTGDGYALQFVSTQGDLAVAATGNENSVTAVNVTDGSTAWNKSTGSSSANGAAISPDGETIVATNNSDTVYAFNSDGSSKWDWTGGGSGGTSIVGVEFSEDGTEVLVADNGGATCLDASDGSEIFVDKNSTGDDVAWSTDGSYYYTGTGSVNKYDRSDHSQVWSYSIASGVSHVFRAPADDLIVAGGFEGELVALDPDDGSVVWETNRGGYADATMRAPSGRVDGVAGRGVLFDESTETGETVDLLDGVVEIVEMQDAEGATITHVDDTTISDIEGLSGTPDSIDTIVSDMDQFDSKSDIKYSRDVTEILDYYGVDATVGESDSSDVQVNEPDYEDTDYDSYNSQEFAEYMDNLESYQKQLETEDDGGSITFPGTDGGGGIIGWLSNLLGIGDLSWLRDDIAGVPMWGWIAGIAAYFSYSGDS